MQPIHRVFLDAIADEQRRVASRRRFLSGSARLAGGGALAAAFVSVPLVRGVPSALAQDFADDLEIANYALTLEHLEYAFYRDGLKEFDQAAFDEAELPEALRKNLGKVRTHEKDHVDFLIAAISDAGGTPVEKATYDFGYDDVEGFLEVAMALENVGVAAYAGAAPFIQSKDILAAALGIHSVEARHAAYLNDINGELPFPGSFDKAMSKDEVLEAAGPFITS